LQSTADNLKDIRGTPRYQTWRCPSPICSLVKKEDFNLSETPEQKRELFEGFALKPESNSNSLKAALMMVMEIELAYENNNKSSAKQR
jgi:hypothetical protein